MWIVGAPVWIIPLLLSIVERPFFRMNKESHSAKVWKSAFLFSIILFQILYFVNFVSPEPCILKSKILSFFFFFVDVECFPRSHVAVECVPLLSTCLTRYYIALSALPIHQSVGRHPICSLSAVIIPVAALFFPSSHQALLRYFLTKPGFTNHSLYKAPPLVPDRSR